MVDFDELRAIADGPALDLPPMAWAPPDDLDLIEHHPFAVWGDEDRSTLRVDLEPGRARIWYGEHGWLTLDEATEVARRLLCAVAMGREVQS